MERALQAETRAVMERARRAMEGTLHYRPGFYLKETMERRL